MAVYEFTCKDCGSEFEVACHMDERDAQALCPKCGSHKVNQKLTAAFSSGGELPDPTPGELFDAKGP
jgi:putative FmdB family regulatory protein